MRTADDAGGDRSAAEVPRDAGRRRCRVRDGGLLPRARAASRRRDPFRRRDLHEPHPGPSRLPSDDGGLLRRQAEAVRRRPCRAARRSSTSTTPTARAWRPSCRQPITFALQRRRRLPGAERRDRPGGLAHSPCTRPTASSSCARRCAASSTSTTCSGRWPPPARSACRATTCVAAIATAGQVPGRFETVDEGQPFAVARRLRPHARLAGERAARGPGLTAVTAAGGVRLRRRPGPRQAPADGGDRPRLADDVFVTSDNPRSEDPEAIIDEILAGSGAESRTTPTAAGDRAGDRTGRARRRRRDRRQGT